MKADSMREKILIKKEIEEIQRKGRELVKKCGNPIRFVPEVNPVSETKPRWSNEDTEKLKEMLDAGVDINKIAEELGRTPDAVRRRILRAFGGVD